MVSRRLPFVEGWAIGDERTFWRGLESMYAVIARRRRLRADANHGMFKRF